MFIFYSMMERKFCVLWWFFIAFCNLFQFIQCPGVCWTPCPNLPSAPTGLGDLFSWSELRAVQGSRSQDAELGHLPERERFFMWNDEESCCEMKINAHSQTLLWEVPRKLSATTQPAWADVHIHSEFWTSHFLTLLNQSPVKGFSLLREVSPCWDRPQGWCAGAGQALLYTSNCRFLWVSLFCIHTSWQHPVTFHMIIFYLRSKLSILCLQDELGGVWELFGAGCTSIKMDVGCCGHHAALRRELIQYLPESCDPRTSLFSLFSFLRLLWISLLLFPLLAAMGEPRRWSGGGNQRRAEWPFGSKCRLPVSRQDRPEPRPDESQCHQWNHEHGAPLHQAPQGHLRGMWGRNARVLQQDVGWAVESWGRGLSLGDGGARCSVFEECV